MGLASLSPRHRGSGETTLLPSLGKSCTYRVPGRSIAVSLLNMEPTYGMTRGGLKASPRMIGGICLLHSNARSLYCPSIPQPIETEKKSSKGILSDSRLVLILSG